MTIVWVIIIILLITTVPLSGVWMGRCEYRKKKVHRQQVKRFKKILNKLAHAAALQNKKNTTDTY